MLPGVVLAAGRSSRFGRPKALADAGGKTFICRILHALHGGGASPLVVVVRPGDIPVRETLDLCGVPVRIVENPRAEEGQLTSLLAGLDEVDDGIIDGIVLALVDMPLVTPATVFQLVNATAGAPELVIRPVHAGRHGHPVVFRRPAFSALRQADPAVGAKAVVRALPTLNVEVSDPGVLADVDTPADYARLFEGGR